MEMKALPPPSAPDEFIKWIKAQRAEHDRLQRALATTRHAKAFAEAFPHWQQPPAPPAPPPRRAQQDSEDAKMLVTLAIYAILFLFAGWLLWSYGPFVLGCIAMSFFVCPLVPLWGGIILAVMLAAAVSRQGK